MERIRIKKLALLTVAISGILGGCSTPGSYSSWDIPPQYQPESGEQYPQFAENSFLDPSEVPLSTFALEVDGASYANMRRMIQQNQRPNADAVRLEEFVNYFPYHYPAPSGNDPLAIYTAVADAPWHEGHALVRVALKAMDIPREKLPPANLVFLVDVSGSMKDWNKLPLLKEALHMLVEQLRPQDRVAIVTYAGNAGEVLPSTSGYQKSLIHSALETLEAGGGTGGQGGIERAYAIAAENFQKDGNNRVILATDGDFNVGLSDPDALGKWIAEKKETGIFLSVLGFGQGNYQDEIMQSLAQNGNGNAAYIDQLSEAKKVLVNEFASTLYTVAQDVKLQVEWNPAEVQSYRLLGYETRLLEDVEFNDDAADAGEIGAGHTVTALYEVVPRRLHGRAGVDPLKYGKPLPESPVNSEDFTGEWLTVKVRYQAPGGSVSQRLEKVVNHSQWHAPDADFRFAMAAAAFAMILRESPHRGSADWEMVQDLARNSLAQSGYDETRQELIMLAERMQKFPDHYYY